METVASTNVLIVDDSATDRKVLKHLLESAGFTITTASDSSKCCDLLDTGPYDIVLLDINMPGMNGFELLQKIKTRPHLRELPVVMMSSDPAEKRVVRSIELGAADFFNKPFSIPAVRARIASIVETHRAKTIMSPWGSDLRAGEASLLKVLVIDDSATVLKFLGKNLTRSGFAVSLADSGERALQLLAEAQSRIASFTEPAGALLGVQPLYDIILLDIIMPGMKGTEVLEKLKSGPPCYRNIPVIVMSSLDDPDTSAECMRLGADDVMAKPFNMEVVKTRINTRLEHLRLRSWVQSKLPVLSQAGVSPHHYATSLTPTASSRSATGSAGGGGDGGPAYSPPPLSSPLAQAGSGCGGGSPLEAPGVLGLPAPDLLSCPSMTSALECGHPLLAGPAGTSASTSWRLRGAQPPPPPPVTPQNNSAGGSSLSAEFRGLAVSTEGMSGMGKEERVSGLPSPAPSVAVQIGDLTYLPQAEVERVIAASRDESTKKANQRLDEMLQRSANRVRQLEETVADMQRTVRQLSQENRHLKKQTTHLYDHERELITSLRAAEARIRALLREAAAHNYVPTFYDRGPTRLTQVSALRTELPTTGCALHVDTGAPSPPADHQAHLLELLVENPEEENEYIKALSIFEKAAPPPDERAPKPATHTALAVRTLHKNLHHAPSGVLSIKTLPRAAVAFGSAEFNQLTRDVCGFPAYFGQLLFKRVYEGSALARAQTTGNQSTHSRSSSSDGYLGLLPSPTEPVVTAVDFVRYWSSHTTLGVSSSRVSRFWQLMCPADRTSIGPAELEALILALIDFHPELQRFRTDPLRRRAYIVLVMNSIFCSLHGQRNSSISYTEIKGSNLVDAFYLVTTQQTRNVLPFSVAYFDDAWAAFERLRDSTSLSGANTNSSISSSGDSGPLSMPWAVDTADTSLHFGCVSSEVLRDRREAKVSPFILSRIFAHIPRKLSCTTPGAMNFDDYTWFWLAEKDGMTDTSIVYWFRCLDIDDDGYLGIEDLRYAYMRKLEYCPAAATRKSRRTPPPTSTPMPTREALSEVALAGPGAPRSDPSSGEGRTDVSSLALGDFRPPLRKGTPPRPLSQASTGTSPGGIGTSSRSPTTTAVSGESNGCDAPAGSVPVRTPVAGGHGAPAESPSRCLTIRSNAECIPDALPSLQLTPVPALYNPDLDAAFRPFTSSASASMGMHGQDVSPCAPPPYQTAGSGSALPRPTLPAAAGSGPRRGREGSESEAGGSDSEAGGSGSGAGATAVATSRGAASAGGGAMQPLVLRERFEEKEASGGGDSVFTIICSLMDFINPALPGKISPIDIKRSGAGPAIFDVLIAVTSTLEDKSPTR